MIPVAVPSYLVPKIADTDSITNKIQSNCSDCFDVVIDVIGEAEAKREATLSLYINGMQEEKPGVTRAMYFLITTLSNYNILEVDVKVLDTEDLTYRALSDRHLCFYPDKRRRKSFQNTLQPQTAFQGPIPFFVSTKLEAVNRHMHAYAPIDSVD